MRLVNRRMIFGLVFVVLAGIIPMVADAQTPEEESLDLVEEIFSQQPDPDNDLALGWLQQIFGDFIFEPWGGATTETGVSATIVSHAVGFSSALAFVFCVVILGYTGLQAVIRTAMEGEVLGKNYSSVWLPFRTAIAFALVIPSASVTGNVVSVAQSMVLSLVIVGSNAGSFLWAQLAEQITNGSPLTAQTQTLSMSNSRSLLRSLVCTQNVHTREGNYIDGGVSYKKLYVTGPLDSQISIPADTSEIVFGNGRRQCGSIQLAPREVDEATSYRSYHADALAAGRQAARAAIEQHLNELAPVALAIVTGGETGLGGGSNIQSVYDEWQTSEQAGRDFQAIQQVAQLYARAAQNFSENFSAQVAAATTGNPAITDKWRDEVTRGGWGAAGAWFFEIARFQQIGAGVSSMITGSMADPDVPQFCGFGWLSERFSSCEKDEEEVALDMTAGVDIVHSLGLAQLADSGDQAGQTSGGTDLDAITADSIDSGIFADISTSLSHKIISITADHGGERTNGLVGQVSLSDSGLADPFRTVSAIGQSISQAAKVAWWAGLVASAASGAAEGAGVPLIGSVTGGVAGALDWIRISLGGLGIALIPMGFVLAFVIPFMPILVWVRLLAAYLLTVIEAVVAAPLAVILMATPEGDGIVGTRLERAIQLLAAIVLRPTLMIIGLVAALLLAYVSFEILNYFFWRVSEMVTNSDIFALLAILCIYTLAAFQVAKTSVTIMQKLQDQVLDWMAAGVGGQGFGDDGSGVDQAISATRGGVAQIGSSVTRSLADQRRQRLSRPEKNDEEGGK